MKKRRLKQSKSIKKDSSKTKAFNQKELKSSKTDSSLLKMKIFTQLKNKLNLNQVNSLSGAISGWRQKLKSLLLKAKHLIPVRNISWKSPKGITAFLAVLIALTTGIVYFNQTTAAAYMLVNGQKVGIVESKEAGQALVQQILQERGQTVHTIAKTHDQIVYTETRVKKGEYWEQALTPNQLGEKLNTYLDGYKLTVAGETLAVLPSKEELEQVLKEYQDYYTKPSEFNKISSVEFLESVGSEAVEVQPEEVKTAEEVKKVLIEGKTDVKEYTVEENDSWWLIARKNDMKTKEVLAGNPGTTEDTLLQPGQKIKLVTVKPYLTVMSKGEFTGKETIPFDVVTKTDTSIASGQSKIVQQGSDGIKEVTYAYEQKNGKEVTKTVLDEKILTPAVNQIVAKGPAIVHVASNYNASRGSGQVGGLSWPLRGHISSYYGYRSRGFHTGLDIEGDTGDPYTAAAAGTVISAGWSGGYGKMILIDHGNGVVTRYAHSSKLLISPGQKVTKGQTIGTVGTTGNTTGPHLHFEIIINGDTVNPLKYLR